MIVFKLNGREVKYKESGEITLLKYLRNKEKLTAAKDGCSGQSACGACLVEINGKPKLSCAIKLKTLNNAEILTLEGIPERVKEIIECE